MSKASARARSDRWEGPVLGRRSARLTFGVSLGLGTIFVLLSPLTGVPGPESALVMGLVSPPFVCAAGARIAIAARATGVSRPGELLEHATWVAFGSIAIPTTILCLNGLRVPWCAPLDGLAFVLMGPGVGVLLAAAVGVLLGAAITRPRLATALAGLVPALAAAGSASLLVTTPAIFAYGHFFGYFPGTLYDPDIAIEAPYLTFRALTAAQIGGLVALVVAALDPATARLSWGRARASHGALSTAAVLLGAAIVGETQATALAHRSTSESIREVLGATVHGRFCDVVVPRELPRERAARLRDDCDFRVEQVAAELGVEQRERITAFFFRSAREKRQLMGASNTYIAKPWRNEVYLQLGGWPHPVLAHEIVHVVAGNVGAGPFRIAGRLGGLLPSPGIIEGLAVALAWEERDELTPHQWARAMMSLGLTPSIARTEGLGFLLEPASRAYVSSGSFVRWILEQRGAAVVRELYRRGDYEGALGVPIERAEQEWLAWLGDHVEVPPAALEMARARFERPGIFAQACPHQVAVLMEHVSDEMAAGDEARAAHLCEQILDIDANDTYARAWLAIALAQSGDLSRARAELARLVGPPSAARPIVRMARRGIGDALWAAGHVEDAVLMYRSILAEPILEEDARQIEVRLLAIESGVPGSAELREILAPPAERPHDAATAMVAIGRLRDLRPDGLGPYLEARQLMQRERYDLAAPALDLAIERGLPTSRMIREARRMEAIVAFANGELDRARSLWDDLARSSQSSEADRVEAADWLERIEWTSRGAIDQARANAGP